MRLQPGILTIFCVAFYATGCSSSSVWSPQKSQEARVFISQTAYMPSASNDIIGCYVSLIGFGGELLDLRSDGTYFHRIWTDLVTLLAGYVGTYHLVRDVVVLDVEGLVILTETERRIEERSDTEQAKVFRLKRIDGTVYVIEDRLEMWFALQSLENGGHPPTEVIADVEYSSFAMRREAETFCEPWREVAQ